MDSRITVDPAVMNGQPCIRGTRLTVDFILALLRQGWTQPDIIRNYPGITAEDIAAALGYVAGTERAD